MESKLLEVGGKLESLREVAPCFESCWGPSELETRTQQSHMISAWNVDTVLRVPMRSLTYASVFMAPTRKLTVMVTKESRRCTKLQIPIL
jgi:hypothetical protein